MAWVVDTCLILDVLDDDPRFGESSAKLLDRYAKKGLVICPVSYIELAPAFAADMARQDYFLRQLSIIYDESWTWTDSVNAHAAWSRYVDAKRQGALAKRPLADIQIGAFAERFDGLLSRNRSDFKPVFPKLIIRP